MTNILHRTFPGLAICCIALLNSAALSHAANLFNWNADQLATTSLGKIVDVHPGTSIDSNVKHGGTGSMRLVIPGNIQNHVGIEPGAVIIDRSKPVFYRWWMKFSPTFKWGPGYNGTGFATMKMNRVKQNGDILPGYYTHHIERDYIAVAECNNCLPLGNGGDPSTARWDINLDPATNPAVTNWHEYIIEIKFESSRTARDGYFKAYLDGVLKQTVTNLAYGLDSMATPVEAWGGMMVRPFPQLNGSDTDGGVIWVDDISTDTTWNSTVGQSVLSSPPPSEPAPPSAPTNLIVE